MIKNFRFEEYEHGYFDSIGSGREFQLFSAHFISKSRTDTRNGALDRYTLPTYGKIIEKSCNFFQKILRHQSRNFSKSWTRKLANFRNFWAEKFEHKNWEGSKMLLQTWKKYKKELAFKKNINAMKDWTIKHMDEVIQD